MEKKEIFQFEMIINVLISSFCFIWIHMLGVYGHYKNQSVNDTEAHP